MNLTRALEVARAYIAAQSEVSGEEFVVVNDRTLERPYGWIFFYETRAYVDTGDELARAVGNAPLLVEKETGKVHVAGSERPIEEYLGVFERYGTFHPGASRS